MREAVIERQKLLDRELTKTVQMAIDTGELAEICRYLPGRAVSALGLTPDGSALYALTSDEGTLLKLDPVIGTVLGQAPDDGYDRLLAVVPW